MTSATSPLESPATDQLGVTFARVVHSEWIKFRTLRSSWAVLLTAVLGMVGIGLLAGYDIGRDYARMDPSDAAPSGPLQGYLLGQLLVGVLGVLFVTGEYSTGMIRSTLTAVPRRLPVLAAKALVFAVVTLLVMVPTMVATFFAGQLFLAHYGHGSSLSDPGVLRVVLAPALYLALIGLLGAGLGWILRSTAGAVSVLIAVLMVVPKLMLLLPSAWSRPVHRYLPQDAGNSLVTSLHQPGSLSPAGGLTVLLVWVLATAAVAAVLLVRRDG